MDEVIQGWLDLIKETGKGLIEYITGNGNFKYFAILAIALIAAWMIPKIAKAKK